MLRNGVGSQENETQNLWKMIRPSPFCFQSRKRANVATKMAEAADGC